MSLSWIKTSAELVTSREATREGFLDQMIEKVQQANPFLERARAFKAALDDFADLETALEDEAFTRLPPA